MAGVTILGNCVLVIKIYVTPDDTNKGEYNVYYKTQLITETSDVKPDRCTSLVFMNIGQVDALILNNIPLAVGDEKRFINEKECHITQIFKIQF